MSIHPYKSMLKVSLNEQKKIAVESMDSHIRSGNSPNLILPEAKWGSQHNAYVSYRVVVRNKGHWLVKLTAQ